MVVMCLTERLRQEDCCEVQDSLGFIVALFLKTKVKESIFLNCFFFFFFKVSSH